MTTTSERYYHNHEYAYQVIKNRNELGWGHKKTIEEVDDFFGKDFFQQFLLQRFQQPHECFFLEIGCGSGPRAAFAAQYGMKSFGVDISQTAIELANKIAKEKDLKIDYRVQDLMRLSEMNQQFDLIYDGHCMHCIVFDDDRKKCFQEIKKSLTEDGFYIYETMLFNPNMKFNMPETHFEFDKNGILWVKAYEGAADTIEKNGESWFPQRRILQAEEIFEEIFANGFQVVHQDTIVQANPNDPFMFRFVLEHA